jgi:3-oxoacyl-[acyl-carrier-protein] synthase-3
MADFISIPAGGTREPISEEVLRRRRHLIHMRGNETFKIAVRSLTEISGQVLAEGNVKPQELTLFVPHQANRRIIAAVGERLGIRDDQVYVNIERVGNTSSASIPIALDEVARQGRLRRDDTVLMSAFGAGLTWGAALLRWSS